MIGRLNILLTVLCVVCALGVISTRDKARKLHSELSREENKQHQLDTEYSQLQVEQRMLAGHGRVDQLARQHMFMAPPKSG